MCRRSEPTREEAGFELWILTLLQAYGSFGTWFVEGPSDPRNRENFVFLGVSENDGRPFH